MMMSEKPAIKPIPHGVLESVAAALRVLAHPQRLRICELLELRELSVGELAGELDIPPAACSQHLNLMRAHGLLSCRRDGKVVHYQVDHPSAINVIHCIRNHML